MLTNFAAFIHAGDMGLGHTVTTQTVSTAMTAIGRMIALAVRENHTKLTSSNKLLPWLAQMLDGWCKDNPASR